MMIAFDYVGTHINKCAFLRERLSLKYINEKHVKYKERSLILHCECLISSFVSPPGSPFILSKGLYHSSDTFSKLMSRDLCRNGDLYLHKKLEGMFVFVSLRHHTSEGEGKKGNDYKIHFLTILEMLPKRTNIVISMKLLNEAERTYVSASD